MEEDSQDCMENTEPVTQSDSGYYESQTQSQPEHWGRLYPLKSSLSVIDLATDSLSYGKIDTDVVITREHLPREVFKKCSKLHFEILRRPIKLLGALTTEVVIIDKSSNGTFVNGHILKKKKSGEHRCRTLRTNDIIGLPGPDHSNYEAYVFIHSLITTTSPIPHSVRQKYQISYRLGAGAFGEVHLVFNRDTGKPHAMKTIVKDTKHKTEDFYKRKLLNELDILKAVRHPNVIELVDSVDCQKEHFLILEFMEGKDLACRIEDNCLEKDLIKLYFYQIVKGVEYLHSQGIIHRDLKPANILLMSSTKETILKISDFGLSKMLSSESMMKTLCGTKMYVAPEVLWGEGSYEYTKEVDVWSMGVILYVCFEGTEPSASGPEEVERCIKKNLFCSPSSEWKFICSDVKSLIDGMLNKDPEERMKIDQILTSDWMQDDTMMEKLHELYSDYDLSNNMQTSSFSLNLEPTASSSLNVTNLTLTNSPSSPPSKKRRTL